MGTWGDLEADFYAQGGDHSVGAMTKGGRYEVAAA